MKWNKIYKNSYIAFREFLDQKEIKYSEEDFLAMTEMHGEGLLGFDLRELYDWFDDKGIYIQIRRVSSLEKESNVFQWKINNSGWSTDLFMCRRSAEARAFEIAFFERNKQWDKII